MLYYILYFYKTRWKGIRHIIKSKKKIFCSASSITQNNAFQFLENERDAYKIKQQTMTEETQR